MVMSHERMGEMLERSRLAIRWGGILGLLCHPIYYLVWTYVLPQPYDNLALRLSAALVCVPLIFQAYWPRRFNHYLLLYWHACLIYVLPFVCTFLAIRNGFSTMWMMTEVMMIFIMALCIDSPLLLMACIGVGVATSSVAAVVTSPVPVVLSTANQSDLALLPVVMLCSMAFSHAISIGRIFVEKNRVLQALAGSIAHEMRNPLSQLKHVLENVEENLPAATEPNRPAVLSHDKAAALYRHLAQGKTSIERGLRIIAMTLDEVSAKPIRSDRLAYLSAAATTRKALEEFGFDDEDERGEVKLLVREDFTFKVDETVYLFILFNLMKNALHHMAARASSTLTLTVERQSIIVRDTGSGIAPEMLAHLFEPFRTSGNSAGTGLGLAYCQRAMQAFGGTIACRSEVDKFTEFALHFPAIPDREVAEYEREMLDRARPVFEGKRILLCDEDVYQRAKTRRVLAGMGAQVSEADNGQLALAMLRERGGEHYDLVLIEANMPALDGYAVAERIRASNHRAIQNILIAGFAAQPGGVAQVLARRAGMDVMLGKAGSVLELIGALQALFESGDRRVARKGVERLSGKSILVADDDTYSRSIAKAWLERSGARVIEAEHGHAVLDHLRAGEVIDAIVMDMNMPGMGGPDTTAAIRARTDAYANVPIVALTGQSDMEAIRECLSVGMDDVLVKPVQAAVLCAAVSTQIARLGAKASPASAEPAPLPPMVHDLTLPTGRELLDELQLGELTALGLIDQTFLDGVAQIRALVDELVRGARSMESEPAHTALHRLLGVSGNIGAKSLHAFGRTLYPRIVDGQWPLEPDWIEQIAALGKRSADALETYFDSVTPLRHPDRATNASATRLLTL
ncbi:MAG: response regulator [Paraburkholderia tropica]|uniref:response regulator n=1 Tax=Paraburkholderia tropica TaxID=92647 RepID=UPI003101AA6C